jgi:hypothetical protein
VKVTPADRPLAYSTASFAIHRWRWYTPWDRWDEDYIITGHKGPGKTITPVNMHVNQPLAPHAAGRVMDNVGTRTYADAARVGICDTRVRPYILTGGTASRPILRPVVASGDPAVGATIWITGGRSGLSWQVKVVRYATFPFGPYVELRNQVLVRPLPGRPWGMGGDSGSPVWGQPGASQAKIHGVFNGWVLLHDGWFMVVSPVSGVEREFPGWRVWHR